ncbi:MAG TPA: 30S ribosomal protein S4 [Armatimonadota bacterium]|nr:30S ribosomal protein S4 [Armatimonadota bacterium]HOM71388.1 30S ribosomal protein S4 [Armatimonadota bacterium]HPP74793.1 30S ribosomal protein S4 [Armatimonadota bacterium]
MATQGTPVCRLCRREGEKLYLKGDKCFSRKCPVERRQYAPGQHGQARQQKLSDYGIQLREKQKMRRIYGVREGQFRNYMKEAIRRRGVTGEILLQLLETRLDNVVYRLGIASSRAQARQLINHGHILVNGKRVDIPSFLVKPGNTVEVAESARKMPPILASVESAGGRALPAWLQFDANQMKGTIVSTPVRDEIDTDVQESLIVEFYSR